MIKEGFGRRSWKNIPSKFNYRGLESGDWRVCEWFDEGYMINNKMNGQTR